MLSIELVKGLILPSLLSSIIATSNAQKCKAVPGTSSWPSESAWMALNNTISGALIKSIPPGGVCHPGQPNYNNASCATVTELWTTSWVFHEDDPVSNAYNNWNNDSCLPYPQYPCSDLGYPIYVVNASKPEHVQAGVNFARENNIRLIVKTSGHDFRGRTVAPYSLSIWTHNLLGLSYHETFQLSGGQCSAENDPEPYNGPAITMAAGENHGAAFAFANSYNLMIQVAAAPTVGLGGYITGGGHSVIGIQKGLAADTILEMSVVVPSGEIVTANACQNSDLFWGLRGGGGSTLGVVLSFTRMAWPSEPLTEYDFGFGSPTLNTDRFWDAMAYMASQFPSISNGGSALYASIVPGNSTNPTVFSGSFLAPNMSMVQTAALLEPIAQHINATFAPNVIAVTSGTEWSSYYDWWIHNPDTTTPIGDDIIIGSRILDEPALNHPNFSSIIQRAMGPDGLQIYLVAGPGTHAFNPDFNAASPAWRTGYVHAVTGVGWPPFDAAVEAAEIADLTNNMTGALRELAPNSGCYLNEANAYEPNFQEAYWGSNYPRLFDIKRNIDPEDVFWCLSCAGSERWEEVGDMLCQV